MSTSRGAINLDTRDDRFVRDPDAVGSIPVTVRYGCDSSLQHLGMGVSYSNTLLSQILQDPTQLETGIQTVLIGPGLVQLDISYWRQRSSVIYVLLTALTPFLVPSVLASQGRRLDSDAIPVAAVGAAMIVVPTPRLVCVPDGFTPPTEVDFLLLSGVLATVSVYAGLRRTLPAAQVVAVWQDQVQDLGWALPDRPARPPGVVDLFVFRWRVTAWPDDGTAPPWRSTETTGTAVPGAVGQRSDHLRDPAARNVET